MLLSEILKDWPCTVLGSVGVVVEGITEHSCSVKKGFLFIARKGACDDGIHHVSEAINRGAVAVIIDRNMPTEFITTSEVTLITVPDVRRFISYASAKLAGNPSESLKVVAVTGTNGKTTVTHFVGQLLKMCGEQAAVIGTTGVYMNGNKIDLPMPSMTTLPAEFLHPLMKLCVEAGMTHVVLEASSLGLSTNRLDHCEIDVGVFLNIGVDHYEEHGGRKEYILAKKKLTSLAENLIVNAEDYQCVKLVSDADKPISFYDMGMTAGLMVPKDLYPNFIPGKHNKSNALAAVSVLVALGYDQVEVLSFCKQLQLPEGRLQRLHQDGVTVYIDYAHTPDALETVLSSLVEDFQGNTITTIFGCGGNRDRGKRPQMGAVAATYSSKVVITSDNPRNEDPLLIINDILAGVSCSLGKISVESDRKKAIQQAIFDSKEGEIILIAGKGHEKTQQVKESLNHFSDYEVAEEALFVKNMKIRTE